MHGLREALDESERQVRELDVQKAEIRRMCDEARDRVEKLTRANKNLTEELKLAQARAPARPNPGRIDSNAPSSRTSIDSTHANMRSPAPKDRASSVATSRSETPITAAQGTPAGLSHGTVDFVYLKNVLLQFLEQKDKGHQRQLIPVLGHALALRSVSRCTPLALTLRSHNIETVSMTACTNGPRIFRADVRL